MAKSATQRDYETIGYVISGRAELQLEGQTLILEPAKHPSLEDAL